MLWVPVALGITDNKTPTTLNAMVAIGIVIGAAAAAKLVTLQTVRRCMPVGVLIGVMVVLFSLQHSLLNAYLLLMLIGALGGFFVVPLNALLQERGKDTVGSGNAIAVQNGENSAMLLMLGLYTVAIKLGAPAVATGVGFGALFAMAIAVLCGERVAERRKGTVAMNGDHRPARTPKPQQVREGNTNPRVRVNAHQNRSRYARVTNPVCALTRTGDYGAGYVY